MHSSAQRRQAWLSEVAISLRKMEDTLTQTMTALMLILDVKTRWSSTHQMLRKWALLKVLLLMKKYIVIGRALDYR